MPRLGVGFTQREVLLWAFTTDFFEQRTAELEEIEAVMAENPQPARRVPRPACSIETHDTRGRLAAVTCPALTLVGEEDILIYPKLSRRLHDELPQLDVGRGPGRPRLPLGVPGRVQRRSARVPGRRPRLQTSPRSAARTIPAGVACEHVVGRGP